MIIFVKHNLIMSSHAYKPSLVSHCTVEQRKSIDSSPTWLDMAQPWLTSPTLSFPHFLSCFLSSHVDSLSALIYPAVPYLSIFPLFSLPRTLPSTLYLTHLFSFLELNLNCYLFLRKSFQMLLLFSHSVMSVSLRLHGLQHARLPCPSVSPGVCSNSCPLSQWCHPTISSSVVPFSSCLHSFPAPGSFPWISSLHQVAKEFSFSISPSNENSGLISFRMVWFDLLSVHGILRSLFQHHSLKTSILWLSAFFMVQVSHPYMMTRKTIAFPCSLSMDFFRQELPSAGDLPNPGIKPRSPALQADSLPSEPPGKPSLQIVQSISCLLIISNRTSQSLRRLVCFTFISLEYDAPWRLYLLGSPLCCGAQCLY